jgi:hypothetical protein
VVWRGPVQALVLARRPLTQESTAAETPHAPFAAVGGAAAVQSAPLPRGKPSLGLLGATGLNKGRTSSLAAAAPVSVGRGQKRKVEPGLLPGAGTKRVRK